MDSFSNFRVKGVVGNVKKLIEEAVNSLMINNGHTREEAWEIVKNNFERLNHAGTPITLAGLMSSE